MALRLLRPPRLRAEDSLETARHVTWLELFFDLVFVVAVAELANLLHGDLTPAGLATFCALFVPVWWSWIDFSYYADQFDTGDLPYQLATFAAMFGTIVLATTLRDVWAGGSVGFVLAYAALRILLIGLYIRAWRHVPESRELAARYIVSFAVALGLWLLSLLVPAPARFLVWGAALLIEIGNGPATYATLRAVPAQVSHMPERFGLFVIVVLGEAVVAVATAVAGTDWRWRATLVAAGGFVAAVAVWRAYFARADATVIDRALRGGRRALLRSYVYGYGHYLVYAGIAGASVGIEAAIEGAAGATLPLGARAALCGATALFLVGIATVHLASPASLPRPLLAARLGAAAACLALVPVGGALSPPALMLLVAGLLVGVALAEAVRGVAGPGE